MSQIFVFSFLIYMCMYAGLIFGTLILEEFKIHFLAWFSLYICVVE